MSEPHLLLMRHGTDARDEGIAQGPGDLPLNRVDRQEVKGMAKKLRAFGVQEIWSSPRRHARESSEIVAEALGLDVLEDARLDEIDRGSWTGQRWGDLRNDARWGAYARDPDSLTPLMRNPRFRRIRLVRVRCSGQPGTGPLTGSQ